METDLKKITSPQRILEIFEMMIARKAQIELWQTISKKHKKKLKAKILKLSDEQIFFTTKDKFEKFNKDDFIYGYTRGSEFVFKAKIKLFSDYKVALSIPEEILFQNMREHPRHDVSKKGFYASFTSGRIMEGTYRTLRHHAKILNYSENGLALMIKKSELPKYYIGDELSLRYSIKGKKVRTGKIVHITAVNDQDYTLGIALLDDKISMWSGVFNSKND